ADCKDGSRPATPSFARWVRHSGGGCGACRKTTNGFVRRWRVLDMRKTLWIMMLVVASRLLTAQTNSFMNQTASKIVLEGRPTTVPFALHLTTTIRPPEPVRSVVLGDSSAFQAEYSPNEPLLVFVRPTASARAQTDLVISTIYGRQFILL